jgi:hypothetical protein
MRGSIDRLIDAFRRIVLTRFKTSVINACHGWVTMSQILDGDARNLREVITRLSEFN